MKRQRKSQNRETPTDSVRFNHQKRHIDASGKFYSKVKTTANKNFFSRQLYPLVFKKPQTPQINEKSTGIDSLPFYSQKGKIIRSITIFKSEVFGSSVFDTTNISDHWLDRTLNNLHFKTQETVIRSYLQFNKGDQLNPVVLSDNERIIRQSAIFEDARFIVRSTPDSDSVDIILVVRDVFPLGFDLKIRNANSSSVKIYNRNILGFGHQLEQSFEVESGGSPVIYFSEGAYKMRNIRRTFTDATFYWQSRPEAGKMGVQLSRPFISPETRYGGGLNIQKASTKAVIGINSPVTSLEFSLYDIWGGYSTIINRYKSPAYDRSVAAITGRYYNINYQGSPSVVMLTLNPSVTINRYISSLSIIRSGYYRSNMVYGFGQTEDIPIGHFAQITAGYETSILNKRVYTGFKLLSGEILQNGGFIYSWFEGGGYWPGGRLTDGMAGLGCDFISRLYKSGSFRIRSFGSFSYKTGINRKASGELPVNNKQYSDTFRSFYASGNQRLSAKAETVVFSPFYLLGFRFAAYSFFEGAIVASSGEFLLNGNFYPAIGLGVRIKNENLAFSTFQLGITFYGRADVKGRSLMFEFNDIPQVNILRFNNEAPEFIGYR